MYHLFNLHIIFPDDLNAGNKVIGGIVGLWLDSIHFGWTVVLREIKKIIPKHCLHSKRTNYVISVNNCCIYIYYGPLFFNM